MKKSHLPPIKALRQVAVGVLLTGASSIAATTPAPATPAVSPSGSKTHVLFVGADISVEKDKKLYHVEDVAGDNFIVTINKQPVRISTDRSEVAIRVDQHMQLTNRTAVVADLHGDRAYTAGGDPMRRNALQAVQLTAQMQETVERAHIAVGIAIKKEEAAANDPSPGGQERLTEATRQRRAAEQAEISTGLLASSDYGMGREQMYQAIVEKEKQLFDAIEITFTVSSAERLAEAYVLVIARVREPESKPGSVRNWIYAKSIGEITDAPRNIHIKHGGFTPGFILEGYDLHLYSAGKEVATNVSPKRVELTKDDAAQYALVDYLTTHKDATLPPVPALGSLPKDYHEHLGSPGTPKVCFVRVSRDGVPTDIYIDETLSEKLTDSYLENVLKQIWFKPGLSKGKPIDGIARVKLTSLRSM